jgi:ribose 5-phosphate isomerase B
MKLAIGSDKSGFSLKEAIKAYLAERGIQADDLGTLDPERAKPYFEVASTIAPMVQNGTYDRAILICGTGMGMAVVANKYQGVYAAVCESTYAAEKCRAINDANILTMGGWIIGEQLGCTMAERFLDTHFTQGLEKWRCEFLTSAREKVKQLETDIYQK